MHSVAYTTEAGAATLIINADDFGLSEGINRGIMELYDAGALKSTSIMVGMPAFEDAVCRARAVGDGIGVGLHLTLTLGEPLTHAPSLIDKDTGHFLSLPALLTRALTGGVDERDLAKECRAQIARARAAGVDLTHLDGHHHVHLAPGLCGVVRHVVESERIPVVRRPIERIFGIPEWRHRLLDRCLIAALARSGDPRRWQVLTTHHFVGGTLLGAPDFHGALLHALDSLAPGTTELMVHPGYVDGPLPGNDAYTTQREVELRALSAPDVLERLQDGGIRLAHFGELTCVSATL
jgi:chitin disaccharide deacetylase